MFEDNASDKSGSPFSATEGMVSLFPSGAWRLQSKVKIILLDLTYVE